LKGAAYIAQSMPLALGRLLNDVDLLVSREDLASTEAALTAAGWKTEVGDEYDERYYREFSHEIPPMRAPGHPLQVDLHHTIAPVTSRVRADDATLFAGIVRMPGGRFCVLDPRDQVIHAAIHLFQDSELTGTLRDLVDIDELIRHHLRAERDWEALVDRSAAHGALGLMWYALHYCREWLGTPIPDRFMPAPPGLVGRALFEWVFRRVAPPTLLDEAAAPGQRFAALLGRIRYHHLRMPPRLLLRHGLHKLTRRASKGVNSPDAVQTT
jgi:hypothetical protein